MRYPPKVYRKDFESMEVYLIVSVYVYRGSLVPRPLPFLPSVCVHNNTREWKTNEKRGRPGSIHHVSGCEVGEGPIFKYICSKLESEFLTDQEE